VQVGAKVAEEWALRILFSLLLDDTVCFLMKKKHCSGLNSPKDYLWPTVNQVVAARLQYKKLTHHHLIATRLPHTPYKYSCSTNTTYHKTIKTVLNTPQNIPPGLVNDLQGHKFQHTTTFLQNEPPFFSEEDKPTPDPKGHPKNHLQNRFRLCLLKCNIIPTNP
jgi:hypothetical protein